MEGQLPYVEFGRDSVDKVWEPHAKQVEFIEIPDSIFEAMYGGAAGGGKSEVTTDASSRSEMARESQIQRDYFSSYLPPTRGVTDSEESGVLQAPRCDL